MKQGFWHKLKSEPATAFFVNFLLAMGVMTLCRLFFYFVNSSSYPMVDGSRLLYLMAAGLRFDLTACVYLNVAYLAVIIKGVNNENRTCAR